MPFDVACIGNLVADVIAKPVTHLPERGKLELVDSLSLHSGGCAMNTGNALGKLGVRTAVLGKVGQDGFGDYLVGRLATFGVDTGGVVRDPVVNTGGTMVMLTPDGERTFLHYIAANATYCEADVDFAIVTDSRVLHLAGYYLMSSLDGDPSAAVLRRAKESGVTTALDTCWDSKGRWLPLIQGCFPYTDYFLPSYDEAKMITSETEPGRMATFLHRLGVRVVGIKLGEQGCYVSDGTAEFTAPPFSVEAADSTGAGDSWVAGFLAGLVRGFELTECARLANAVGACCVQGVGASSGIRTWEDTLAFAQMPPATR